MAVVRLGGGRSHPAQQIDPAVGFSTIVAAGTEVSAGEPIAMVHAATSEAAAVAQAEYLAACRFEGFQPTPLIHQVIG
jgi:thymidine phosphorylase